MYPLTAAVYSCLWVIPKVLHCFDLEGYKTKVSKKVVEKLQISNEYIISVAPSPKGVLGFCIICLWVLFAKLSLHCSLWRWILRYLAVWQPYLVSHDRVSVLEVQHITINKWSKETKGITFNSFIFLPSVIFSVKAVIKLTQWQVWKILVRFKHASLLQVVLCCLTSRYAVSESCTKEISLADLLRKPIVPIMVERTPWPPPGPNVIKLYFSVIYELS